MITIKAAIVNAGYTQAAIAEKLGVSRRTIHNIVNGKIDAKPIYLIAIACVCNVDANELCVNHTP